MRNRQVVALYYETRARARTMSVIRLRFNARRIARQATTRDDATSARRAAYRDELLARGHQLP